MDLATSWRGRTPVLLSVAAAALLALGAAQRGAAAWVQEQTGSGEGLRWFLAQISYELHEAGSDDVPGDGDFEAVHASFRTWQSQECLPLAFTYAGPTDRTAVGFDPSRGVGMDNLVIWRESAADWLHGRTVIALTSVTYSPQTGEIVDADIELNGVSFDGEQGGFSVDGRASGTDIQNTVTHEIGHVLGLGHSSDPQSTMVKRATVGDTSLRTLGDDDIDAICTIYADGPPTGDSGGGCASASHARETAAPLLLLLAAGALLGRGLRRARRARAATLALGLLFAALAPSSPAAAYVLYTTDGGTPLRWWTDEVPYQVDEAGTEALDGAAILSEVQASFATWEALDCAPLRFRFDGLHPGLAVRFDDTAGAVNENAVLWVPAAWSHGRRVIALTTLLYHPLRGEIVDADIEFNDEDFDFDVTGEAPEGLVDVRNALTHEIGHLLGIDHSDVAGATMAPRAAPSDLDKRDLAEDDIAAFCTVYATPWPGADTGGGAGDAGAGRRDAGGGSRPDGGATGGTDAGLDGNDGGRSGCAAGGHEGGARLPVVALGLLGLALLAGAVARRRPARCADLLTSSRGSRCGSPPCP